MRVGMCSSSLEAGEGGWCGAAAPAASEAEAGERVRNSNKGGLNPAAAAAGLCMVEQVLLVGEQASHSATSDLRAVGVPH